jgi:alkaline phosphatase
MQMRTQSQARKLTVLLVIGLLISMGWGCATLPKAGDEGQANNIILLIGDGLGPSHFAAAWLYSSRVLNKDLHMVQVMQSGRTGYIVNDTADSMVTESAAAATQIACGIKVPARAVGMGSDGKTPCKTILEIAKDKGMATGLVTTSGITDATPASFAAHVEHRSDETAVATQELKLGVDVLMGGRRQFFLPEAKGGKRKDGRDLTSEAPAAGYVVVATADELQKADGPRILGLFNIGNMVYDMDRAKTQEPSLAQMASKTLNVLSRNPKGFFAMIEAGRIDHASHRNDAPATIREILAFDEAVGVALEFQKRNPRTLIIVTADHETGGMALIGHSKTSTEYVGMDLRLIQKAEISLELLAMELGKNPSPEKIQDAVKRHLSIEITTQEAKVVADDVINKLDPKNYGYATLHSLAFVLRPYYRVGWGSQTHTASLLLAFGSGPGSGKLPGFHHNTELFHIMKAAMGD